MKSQIGPEIRNENFQRIIENGHLLTQAEIVLQTFLRLGWASDEDVYYALRANTEFMRRFPKFGRQTVPARRNDLFNSLDFLASYTVQERRGPNGTQFLISRKVSVRIEPRTGQAALCFGE